MKSPNNTNINLLFWLLSGFILSVFVGTPSISLAEDLWTYKTDMPTKRVMTGGGVIHGKIYVIGGAPSNSSVTSVVEMYDPIIDTWTRMADMPSGRCYPATCIFDGKIYVFGGVSPNPYSMAKKNVFVYDPQTDSWNQKRDMPYANAMYNTAVVDGVIYLIGGMPSAFSPPFSTVMAYDPISESWTQKADMSAARGGLSACVVDGKIYAIGGTTQYWTTFSYKLVEVYDPSTDTWTRKSDMPTQRWGLGTCVVDGKIYAIGGRSGGDICATNEVYDPVTDTWTIKSPMQQKRNGALVCSIKDKIYSIGGVYKDPQDVFLSTVEEYDTGLGVASPDFNGDGIVDSVDMCMMIDYWGTDEPLYDIAPPPFGDGIVDVQDLILLSEYLFEEIFPPELIAYWKMDEAEDFVAYDSAGANDAVLIGGAVWQPSGGKLNGALQLDGIDGYAVTGQVLNPTNGPFSVLAWIKGGTPSQVIISQMDGSGSGKTWLGIDPTNGCLMTELCESSRNAGPLISETVITGSTWHRIGFVWDGFNRSLYVDDILVAEDTEGNLQNSDGGLYFGVNKNLDAGTFFYGLIDDVRIYNVVLTAEEIAAMAQ
ncbi:LamG-like jellyroll fold domain-containing protein [Planctomycetota bacterium]